MMIIKGYPQAPQEFVDIRPTKTQVEEIMAEIAGPEPSLSKSKPTTIPVIMKNNTGEPNTEYIKVSIAYKIISMHVAFILTHLM